DVSETSSSSGEEETIKTSKRGFFARIGGLFKSAFNRIRSRFSTTSVNDAVTKVASHQELAVEYLRCLNVGDARTNFRRGDSYCRTLGDDSHRKFCNTLVQMAMQILQQIRLCQKDRSGTQRRACFFKVKAPLMHPTFVEIGSNLHEEYIEGFVTRAPDFRVVPESAVSQIHHHTRLLNWREILLHSFDIVAIAASNRLWEQTHASLQSLSHHRLVESQRRQAMQQRAFRFHRRQRAILDMPPHPDPVMVGILHELVFKGNVCRHKSDYRARLVREIGDKRVVTTVKEQTKLAFIFWIRSLYSVEECMHPPFLRPSETSPEDEESARESREPGVNSADEAEPAEKLFGAAPSSIQVQNCELVRKLFRLTLESQSEDILSDHFYSDGTGELEASDGDLPQDTSTESGVHPFEGDEVPRRHEESAKLELPLTAEQRVERKAFIESLNAVVSSSATLSVSILLNKSRKGYKVLEFAARSRFVTRMLASFSFKLVLHLFSQTYDLSAIATEVGHSEKYPPGRQTEGLAWHLILKAIREGALPLRTSDVFASSYVQSLGATVEILTGSRNVGNFATQVLVIALNRRRELWRRISQSGLEKKRDDIGGRIDDEEPVAPDIDTRIRRSRRRLTLFRVMASAVLCAFLLAAGAWAIPVLLAVAVVGIAFVATRQNA
ncbi:putative transmembrane protein, partial [Toxoplasma gondii CAST]